MISFEAQTALVTGGTRGIGRAIADRLRELGAEVFVTGRSPDPPAGLAEFGYLAVDFSDPGATSEFCKTVAGMENLDVLVNNAGINRIHNVEDYPYDDLEEVIAVNCMAVYRVAQAGVRAMLSSGREGRIVNVGSIWATQTRKGRSVYCASKSGVLGMTRGVAVDVAERGILVNAVSPGFVRTELTERTMGPEGIREVSGTIPVGRLADPPEIAEVVAFLASRNNSYLTGQNIIVDGGFTNV